MAKVENHWLTCSTPWLLEAPVHIKKEMGAGCPLEWGDALDLTSLGRPELLPLGAISSPPLVRSPAGWIQVDGGPGEWYWRASWRVWGELKITDSNKAPTVRARQVRVGLVLFIQPSRVCNIISWYIFSCLWSRPCYHLMDKETGLEGSEGRGHTASLWSSRTRFCAATDPGLTLHPRTSLRKLSLNLVFPASTYKTSLLNSLWTFATLVARGHN